MIFQIRIPDQPESPGSDRNKTENKGTVIGIK